MSSGAGKKRKTKDSDECEVVNESESDEGKARHGGKRVCPKRTAFQVEDDWTIKERKRLLEALKTFPLTSVESIAKYVGTRTPKQVTAKFDSIRNLPGIRNTKAQEEIKKDQEKAPLELWLSLVKEVINQERTDLSQNLGKVVSLLGRHDMSSLPPHPRLKWQNIYQYFSDLLENRAHLQTLTDLEAYVVLDLMHDLGKTLRTLNTEKQIKVLEKKYRLLRSHPSCFQQPARRDDLVVMALSNDFSLLDDDDDNKNDDDGDDGPSSPSTSLPLSSVDPALRDKSRTVQLSHSSQPSTSSTSHEGDQTPSSSPSSSNPSTSAPTSNSVSSTPVNVSTAAGAPDNHLECTTSGCSTANLPINAGDGKAADETPPNLLAWTPESGYSRPRYFTMNPLCIPQNILNFKAKKS